MSNASLDDVACRTTRARILRRALLAAVALATVVGPGTRTWSGPGGTDAPPAPRQVALKTEDGTSVAGTYWPSGAASGAGVVLLPMYKLDRTSWRPVVDLLTVRGVGVLAIDPRGHGQSRMQGKEDLSSKVASRDPALFAAMHQDAIAAVRWLSTSGGCDPKRIAIVGASVGGSIAVDTARRHATEVASIAWLSPGPRYLGLDTLAHLKQVPAAMPMLLLCHREELPAGARRVVDARPTARFVAYDTPPPRAAGAERGWAHGTEGLEHLPLVKEAIASFVTAATGSKTEDVVLDGLVEDEGVNADPWDRAIDVAEPGADGSVRAFRVGRRILFGGRAAPGVVGLRFEVQTGNEPTDAEAPPMLGPPQIVAVDLREGGRVAWTWGGMGSMPFFPGMDANDVFGKTTPTLRAVRTDAGTSFEGEWYIPKFGGESPAIRLLVGLTTVVPPLPRGGVVGMSPGSAVDLPSR